MRYKLTLRLLPGVLLSASHRELVAQRLLFDFAHAVGRSDARNFMRKMNLSFGPEGLSAGPVHFSYTGWAVVQLHDTCRPSPNAECYLYYDHPFSFESYSWNSQQVRTRACCVLCVVCRESRAVGLARVVCVRCADRSS